MDLFAFYVKRIIEKFIKIKKSKRIMAKIALDHLEYIVEAVFAKYDVNRNGYLETNEILTMLMDAFRKMNSWRKVDDRDILELLSVSNKSQNGKINKRELADIFRKYLRISQNNLIFFSAIFNCFPF
jgi:Ca2+-binding EF-hand superfamily protein